MDLLFSKMNSEKMGKFFWWKIEEEKFLTPDLLFGRFYFSKKSLLKNENYLSRK